MFHLAGKVHALAEVDGNESEYVRANLEGTRNVLNATVKAGVQRFVFVSSVNKVRGEGSGACRDEAAGQTCIVTGKLACSTRDPMW